MYMACSLFVDWHPVLLPLRGGDGAQGVGQDATAKITQLPQTTLLSRPELRYVIELSILGWSVRDE